MNYKDKNGKMQQYKYQKNKAVVFGSLSHSSDIAVLNEAAEAEVLFSFTFGSDKMEHWKNIYESMQTQFSHYMHPSKGWSCSKWVKDKDSCAVGTSTS